MYPYYLVVKSPNNRVSTLQNLSVKGLCKVRDECELHLAKTTEKYRRLTSCKNAIKTDFLLTLLWGGEKTNSKLFRQTFVEKARLENRNVGRKIRIQLTK